MKDWIQTYTGKQFWPLAPRVEDIDIRDIAHALSMKCRYTGHCREFYSVAEHSVHVSWHVPKRFALWGLLHDAGEAYLPDVARPIKKQLVGFEEIEARVMRCVCLRYDLPLQEPPEVKETDTRILRDEYLALMEPAHEWNLPLPGLGVALSCWIPDAAERQFCYRFEELWDSRYSDGAVQHAFDVVA